MRRVTNAGGDGANEEEGIVVTAGILFVCPSIRMATEWKTILYNSLAEVACVLTHTKKKNNKRHHRTDDDARTHVVAFEMKECGMTYERRPSHAFAQRAIGATKNCTARWNGQLRDMRQKNRAKAAAACTHERKLRATE